MARRWISIVAQLLQEESPRIAVWTPVRVRYLREGAGSGGEGGTQQGGTQQDGTSEYGAVGLLCATPTAAGVVSPSRTVC